MKTPRILKEGDTYGTWKGPGILFVKDINKKRTNVWRSFARLTEKEKIKAIKEVEAMSKRLNAKALETKIKVVQFPRVNVDTGINNLILIDYATTKLDDRTGRPRLQSTFALSINIPHVRKTKSLTIKGGYHSYKNVFKILTKILYQSMGRQRLPKEWKNAMWDEKTYTKYLQRSERRARKYKKDNGL